MEVEVGGDGGFEGAFLPFSEFPVVLVEAGGLPVEVLGVGLG